LFLSPIPWIIYFPVNKLFSLLIKKYPNDNDSDELTEKELKVFIEESTKEGVIESEDKEMIESILEFGDTIVKEIMTPRVDMIYISKDITLDEMIQVLDEKKKSRYPVIDKRIDNITGIILAKDVFSNLNNTNFAISDVIRPAFFIPETMRILKLLNEMQRTKQKFAIVVDEFGGVSGLITMEDIVEEIVGEISDEYDEDIQQIIKEKDYFIVNGNTEIDELNSTLKISIDDDEDFQTVAGLINFETGKIPKVNDKIKIKKYIFKILEVEKNRITKVKIYEDK
jgi:CBS domain containing-hemolysin-like protein